MSERGGGGVVGGLPPQLLSEEPLAPRAGDTVWNSDLGTHTLRTIFLSSAFFLLYIYFILLHLSHLILNIGLLYVRKQLPPI